MFGLYLLPLYVLWFFMYTCMYAYNYVHVHCFICVTFTGEEMQVRETRSFKSMLGELQKGMCMI